MILLNSKTKNNIVFLIIFTQITQFYGCATVATNQEQYAELFYDGYFTNSKQMVISNILVDDNQPIDQSKLVQGHHKITAEVIWSTEQKDKIILEGDFLAGKKYVLLGYELSKGQDLTAVVVRPKDFKEQGVEAITGGLTQGFLAGIFPLIIMTAPIWILIAYIIEQSENNIAGKPFDNCCFVWIEELETRKIVAGESPLKNTK